MGIPCRGLDVPIHRRWVEKGKIYSKRYLESQLDSLPVGEEFTKFFLILTCATIFAPNSKLKGMHDLGISYGTLMSQSQEIGENSCLTIWKMASRNSKQQTEDMCGDVCYSCRQLEVDSLYHLSIKL